MTANNGGAQEERNASRNGDFPRAVIYLRVSTKEQAEVGGEAEGYSIPAQRAACRRKADSLGAVIEEEFVDRGESAKTANRPELLSMLRYLRETPTNYVIVHKVDRLARNRADDVVITMEIKKSGATLVSCSENIDETPSGLLLHGIMSSIAEFYSRNLATEVAKGMNQKAQGGGTTYLAPIGYVNTHALQDGREVRSVILDSERAPLVKWAFETYATGEWTLRRLLEAVTERGLTRRAGPHRPARPLAMSALHAMLCNTYYKGMVTYRGVSYPGRHEALISEELFECVQAVLAAHNQAGERQHRHNHYLKGSLYCGNCGARLATEHSRSRNGNLYHYFYCLGRQYDPASCNRSVLAVSRAERLVVDHYRTIQLSPERIEKVREVLREALSARRSEAEAAERTLALRIERLSNERQKLLQLHYAEALPLELFKTEQERITRELGASRDQLAEVSLEFETIEQNLNRALELARDCHAAYKAANPAMRRLFNQAFFKKICIHDDGEITHDLAEPFKILLDPKLGGWLASERGAASEEDDHSHDGDAEPADDAGETAEYLGRGSNFEVMVPPAGIEPAISSSHRRLSAHLGRYRLFAGKTQSRRRQ